MRSFVVLFGLFSARRRRCIRGLTWRVEFVSAFGRQARFVAPKAASFGVNRWLIAEWLRQAMMAQKPANNALLATRYRQFWPPEMRPTARGYRWPPLLIWLIYIAKPSVGAEAFVRRRVPSGAARTIIIISDQPSGRLIEASEEQ